MGVVARILSFVALVLVWSDRCFADATRVGLASPREHYSNTEAIELSIVPGELVGEGDGIELRVEGGRILNLAVPVQDKRPRFVTIQAGTLMPGRYTAAVTGDTHEPSAAEFYVHSAEHANAYWIGQWVMHGEPSNTAAAKGGWMYLTGDYVAMPPRPPGPADLAEGHVVPLITFPSSPAESHQPNRLCTLRTTR